MDAAKRREARRKKLLESSEDRFKRIERLKMRSQELEDVPCDSGNVGSSVQASVDEPCISGPLAPVSQPSEEQRSSTTYLRGRKEDSHTRSTKPSVPSHDASGHHAVHHAVNPTVHCRHVNSVQESTVSREEISPAPAAPSENSIPRDVSQDSGFVEGMSTPQSRTQPCDQSETQYRTKAAEKSVQSVISLQTVVFTLLAVVTRLWLVSLLQGQSIIVLFFATEVLLFVVGLEQSSVHSGPVRIITALLTFKGASPETVQRVQRCLGFFQGTLRDFSTFLFVFIMVHAAMEWSSSPLLDQSETVPEV